MRVLPVIDLRGGMVVRPNGAARADYPVWESEICPTGEPLPLAFALHERYGFDEVYVADLDALLGGSPDLEFLAGLPELELSAWCDAGVRGAGDALKVRAAGASVIAASESLHGPDAWLQIVRTVDARKLGFSLDLRDGRPVAPGWEQTVPEFLAEAVLSSAAEINGFGPARLFVIDLARVGTAKGPGNELLLSRLVKRYPETEIYVGGGVRDSDDLKMLDDLGVAGALVASALHDGTFQPRRHS